MRKNISILLASITWFSVLAQYYLMIENRAFSVFETTIRFLSFFTILTNSLVAIYFTLSLVKKKKGYLSIIDKPGTLTAVTVHITVVGLVYQIILRYIWVPYGFQMIVNEILHSLMPVLVIIYWYFNEKKRHLTYKQIPRWLIYPFVYLILILIRGHVSNFYPYPFVDVNALGLTQVLINSILITLLFILISCSFIKLGKMIKIHKWQV